MKKNEPLLIDWLIKPGSTHTQEPTKKSSILLFNISLYVSSSFFPPHIISTAELFLSIFLYHHLGNLLLTFFWVFFSLDLVSLSFLGLLSRLVEHKSLPKKRSIKRYILLSQLILD